MYPEGKAKSMAWADSNIRRFITKRKPVIRRQGIA
jgi:hypothetical protein